MAGVVTSSSGLEAGVWVATRNIPAAFGHFDSAIAAWARRRQSGPGGTSTVRTLGRLLTPDCGHLAALADWTERIAAGELPPSSPSRPAGIEPIWSSLSATGSIRNITFTIWSRPISAIPTECLWSAIRLDRIEHQRDLDSGSASQYQDHHRGAFAIRTRRVRTTRSLPPRPISATNRSGTASSTPIRRRWIARAESISLPNCARRKIRRPIAPGIRRCVRRSFIL